MSASLYNMLYDGVVTYQLWERDNSNPILSLGDGIIGYRGYIQPLFKIGGQCFESTSFTKTVVLSPTKGIVAARFFKETGSVLPVPPPSGTYFPVFRFTTSDPVTMSYYTSGSELNGLNSGSNEWSAVTPDAAYVSHQSYRRFIATDSFYNYVSGSILTGSNVIGGEGSWVNIYSYFGSYTYRGLKIYDIMNLYSQNTILSSSITTLSGGVSYDNMSLKNTGSWNRSWYGRNLFGGLKIYDTMNLYSQNIILSSSITSLTGGFSLNDISFENTGSWNGSWYGRNLFGGLKIYDMMNLYSQNTTLSLNTTNLTGGFSLNDISFENTGTWNGSWYGNELRLGIKAFDNMLLYINGTYANGSGSNLYNQWNAFPTNSFVGAGLLSEVKAFDNMSLYTTGTYVNGSGSNPYDRYTAFVDNSFVGDILFYTLKAFDNMSLYTTGTYVNGSGSNPYDRYVSFGTNTFLGESY